MKFGMNDVCKTQMPQGKKIIIIRIGGGDEGGGVWAGESQNSVLRKISN